MVLSEEAMAWRRKGIGGSDARTIAHGTAADWMALKAEKIDGVRPTFTKEQRLLMDLGVAAEPIILDYLHNNVVEVALRNQPSVMKADDFFRCTLDGITALSQPIQCKFHTGDRSIEDLAEYYWPQLQHELLVTGSKMLILAVVFGHYGKFDHTQVEPDYAYQSQYMERALHFKAFCWDDKPLPSDLAATAGTLPAPNIPRLRDHVWPAGDNRIAALARDWLDLGAAAQSFNEAAAGLKKEVPEDCRSASWIDGNGVGIRISVSKSGAKTIKPYVVRS
jgi:predicted phage-related endonuclease